MGRALLIICSGLTIIFGIVQTNMQGRQKEGVAVNADYAKTMEARDLNNAAIDLALQQLSANPNWRNGGVPWQVQLDYGSSQVLIEDYNTDTLRLTATSPMDNYKGKVVALCKQTLNSALPKIPASLGIYNNSFSFSANGDFGISGIDSSGSGQNLPGIAVINSAAQSTVLNGAGAKADQITGTGGTPSVAIDNTLDYNPVENLINILANDVNSQYLPGGTYTGSLGSASDPGVFIVDNQTKFTGGTPEGYGIIVVRHSGVVDVDSTSTSGSLTTTGNFKFNGLIIFENGWGLTGTGTSQINGSVLVGSTSSTTTTDITFNGTTNIQYNSQKLQYAQTAAARAVNPGATYKIVKLYE